jgi:hypothetical protein
MNIVVLTPDELEEMMQRTATMAAKAAIQDSKPIEIKEDYISRKDTAKKFGVCLNTLESRTKAGLIKSYRFGRSIRYKRTEVEAALTLRNFGGK